MKTKKEEFKVSGEEVIKKVKHLIKEGNARRVIIENEKGEVLIEIPLTIGAVSVLLLPTLAAIGAIAAVVTKCTIIIERKEDSSSDKKTANEQGAVSRSKK